MRFNLMAVEPGKSKRLMMSNTTVSKAFNVVCSLRSSAKWPSGSKAVLVNRSTSEPELVLRGDYWRLSGSRAS